MNLNNKNQNKTFNRFTILNDEEFLDEPKPKNNFIKSETSETTKTRFSFLNKSKTNDETQKPKSSFLMSLLSSNENTKKNIETKPKKNDRFGFIEDEELNINNDNKHEEKNSNMFININKPIVKEINNNYNFFTGLTDDDVERKRMEELKKKQEEDYIESLKQDSNEHFPEYISKPILQSTKSELSLVKRNEYNESNINEDEDEKEQLSDKELKEQLDLLYSYFIIDNRYKFNGKTYYETFIKTNKTNYNSEYKKYNKESISLWKTKSSWNNDYDNDYFENINTIKKMSYFFIKNIFDILSKNSIEIINIKLFKKDLIYYLYNYSATTNNKNRYK